MSFLTDASLVFIPSGYKEDKAYSIKPTDGSGDLTFARASDGTRVNSDGLVERVPWNLLQQSNTFSTTWSLSNATVTSGQSGYDGSSNAWLLQTTASGGRVVQSITANGLLNYSIYAKSGNVNWIALYTAGSPYSYVFFDLQNGVVGTSVGGNTIDEKITSVGDGWHRCSITANTSTTEVRVFVATADNTLSAASGDNIYIQDAQLNEGTLKPYFPTTNRQDVPRLDYSNGCPCLLLEPQRTNLLTYSEQFDNGAWSKNAVSVTANNTTSPDGTQNADLITADGTTTQHYILQTQTQSAKTISFFVKMGTQRYVQILTSGSVNALANYDLETGTVGGLGSASTAQMIDFGNDWWRIVLTSTDSLTGNVYLCYVDSLTQGRFPSTTSTGTIWVWGAMAENGASYPTSYIPTTSASVTRIYEAIADKDIRSLSIGNSYTLMFDMTMAAQDNNKLFYNMRTSSAVDSFSVRNFTGGFRAYNNIDASYPFPSTTADNGKYILRVDGTTVDLFAVVSGASTKQTATISTARDFGYFYIDGSPTKINLFEHIIFDSALTDDQCEYLTGNSYSTYATMASQLNYTIQ